MGATNKRYPAEVRELAVRLFQEQVHEHPSLARAGCGGVRDSGVG